MKEVCLTDKEYVFGRHTKTQRRRREEIGIHAVRGGTVTGEHEVDFFGDDEVVTITHSAASRKIFALARSRPQHISSAASPASMICRTCCWRSPA